MTGKYLKYSLICFTLVLSRIFCQYITEKQEMELSTTLNDTEDTKSTIDDWITNPPVGQTTIEVDTPNTTAVISLVDDVSPLIPPPNQSISSERTCYSCSTYINAKTVFCLRVFRDVITCQVPSCYTMYNSLSRMIQRGCLTPAFRMICNMESNSCDECLRNLCNKELPSMDSNITSENASRDPHEPIGADGGKLIIESGLLLLSLVLIGFKVI